jgi:hypothetical protein
MTLLAGEALKIAEHALGGAVDPVITGLRCLNETGEWLVSARPWIYLRGGMEALDLTLDQDYIDLPADFGAIVSMDRASGSSTQFFLLTVDELLELRQGSTLAGAGTIWGAVVYDHADITGTSDGVNYNVTASTASEIRAKKHPTARLDIYPTPTLSTTGALLLYYTRGWRGVEEDTDTIFVPSWLEGVYLRALRIWAKGYEEEDSFNKDQALQSLTMGMEWRAAVTRDSNIQTEMGVLRGGAAAGHTRWRNLDGTSLNPS